jgi:hypothetical protein
MASCEAADCAGAITMPSPDTETAAFLAGFIAAEGCFTQSGTRFRFAIGLGATDAGMCELALTKIGAGFVRYYGRRKPHYDDEVVFVVQATEDLVELVVPFMDEHLDRESHKYRQYATWRAKLLEYWEHGARRCRPCTIEGCEAPQRGKGVCRKHYYALYGV